MGPASQAAITPELELLCLCMRPLAEAAVASRLTRLAASVKDWNRVLDLAQRHRASPLLHAALMQTCPREVPPDVLQQTHRRFLVNAARNAILLRVMYRTLDLLAQNGIQAAPFKGLTLAQSLYGDISFRQIDDLDILLRRGDIKRAKHILIAHGYRPHFDFSVAEQDAHLDAGWGCQLLSENEDVCVELDSGIAPERFGFRTETAAMLSRLEAMIMDGRTVRTLSGEDHLLLLCAHGSKHAWTRIIWVSDVGRLLRRLPDSSCEQALAQARTQGVERMLLLGVELARLLMEVPLPQPLNAAIGRDPRTRSISKEIIPCLCDGPRSGSSTFLRSLRYEWNLRERLRDRIRSLLVLAVIPSYSDWKSVPLPGWLFPLYYVIRPFRLAWKGVQHLARTKKNSPLALQAGSQPPPQ